MTTPDDILNVIRYHIAGHTTDDTADQWDSGYQDCLDDIRNIIEDTP